MQANRALEVVPSGQLVTFTLDNVEFGIDIDRIQEITQYMEITPVPGAPGFVLGVVNLRGMIIPVLDCRQRFHLMPTEATPRTRIMILNLTGQPTGLQVDSVSEVVRLDDFTLKETPPLVAGVRSDYLAGMVTAHGRLITLINLDKILDSEEFAQRERLLEAAASTQPTFGTGSLAEMPEAVEEELPYVTFKLGQESFGLSLQFVEEIIELPDITKVPDAPPYVLGVICLREQVLPILDIEQLLRVQTNGGTSGRDMVILLSFGQSKMGIVVDAIQEIIRVRDDQILPPPQTLGEADAERMEGIVLRPDRMVSLVKILNVISGEDHDKLAAIGSQLGIREEDTQAASNDLPLVVFRLGDESFALRLHDVREIIMVGLITPVPRAPSFIEGVLNLRGEVMPVIDLRDRFGLDRQEPTSLSRIIITPIAGVFTGLVVDAVEEVKNVDQRILEDPPRVTWAGANAYIQKVARTEAGVIFLLDLHELLTEAEGSQLGAFGGKKKS